MTDRNWLEDRVEALIAGYADRAPTDVDAMRMTRLVTSEGAGRRFPVAAGVAARMGLAFALLSIALLVTIAVGALLGVGRLPRDDPEDLLERRQVAPFVGVPPIDAAASSPENGDLVVLARGRCTDEGAFCFVWIYADGRLIWLRDGALPFGANEHSTGLLEQRLAPSGVTRLAAEFSDTRACGGPDQRVPIVCAPRMPGPAPFPKIPDPGWIDPSWGLPASAWEDPSIWAFVPSRMGACFIESNIISASSYTSWQRVEPSRVLAWLPPGAVELLNGRDIEFPSPLQSLPSLPMTCFGVTTDEARSLSDILSRAGLKRDEGAAGYVQGYHVGAPSPFEDAVIWFGPILPHGEWLVSGGG